MNKLLKLLKSPLGKALAEAALREVKKLLAEDQPKPKKARTKAPPTEAPANQS